MGIDLFRDQRLIGDGVLHLHDVGIQRLGIKAVILEIPLKCDVV